MNWDAIAAVGELLAAVAVLISILYLARQIRQSTTASVLSLHQGISQAYQGINELIAGSPDLADIIVRGATSRADLSPAEIIRFDCLMTNFFNIIEHVHQQESGAGILTSQSEEMLAAVLRKRLVFPGVSEWWLENVDDFTIEFVEWVNRTAAQQVDEADVE
jgi:hypothetical protein